MRNLWEFGYLKCPKGSIGHFPQRWGHLWTSPREKQVRVVFVTSNWVDNSGWPMVYHDRFMPFCPVSLSLESDRHVAVAQWLSYIDLIHFGETSSTNDAFNPTDKTWDSASYSVWGEAHSNDLSLNTSTVGPTLNGR